MREERLIVDVALPLLRVGLAAQVLVAARTAPAGEKADARRALVAHDEIGVVAKLGRAVGIGERRQLQARAEIDQHLLPGPHVAIRRDDRMADRIGRRIGLRDRSIEQRDRIEAFEIGRIGQHQIGVVDGLGLKRIDHHQERDLVVAADRPARASIACVARGVHRRIPRHVRHEEAAAYRSDTDRPPRHWRSPCASRRARRSVRPRNTRDRCAAVGPSASIARSSGRIGNPSGRRVERRIRRIDDARIVLGQLRRRDRPRKRRARAKIARPVERAEQHLNQDAAARRSGSRSSAPRCRASRRARPGGRPPCRAGGPTRRSRRSAARSSRETRPRPSRGRAARSFGRQRRNARRPPPARSRRRGSARRRARTPCFTRAAVGEWRNRRKVAGSRSAPKPSTKRAAMAIPHLRLTRRIAQEQAVLGGAGRMRSRATARWCSATRNAQSTSSRLSSTCTIASASRPSVPGRIGIHSSAIAE